MQEHWLRVALEGSYEEGVESKGVTSAIYLKHQDKVVHRLVAHKQEMLCRPLVLLVELELLHHAGVLQQPKQDLLRQVGGLERLHL